MQSHLSTNLPLRLALVGGLLGVLLLTLLAANSAAAQSKREDKLAGKVSARVLSDTANGKSAAVLVSMADQANLSDAYNIGDQDKRGWYVYDTLRAQADKTQADLRQFLTARGVKYESLWIGNAMAFDADRTLVDLLAARADVGAIASNAPMRAVDEPAPVPATSVNSPDDAEWGVQSVNAPQVWAMGYTGQGIVIGGSDTGIRWSHEALVDHYRGWNGSSADHNYNWYDAIRSAIVGGSECGYASAVPCDDYFHGTHTIGTAVGGVGSNEIGVAPGAEWIGCRNMDNGVGRPSTYMGCYQFMAAPTDLNGNNANPTLRADIITNSWGCPPDELCTDPNVLNSTVEAVQAAGIFIASSAGNSGSSCSTIDEPSAIYSAVFTAGAYDIDNALASLSSRGPVTVDGSNRLKPNIVAPGVNVRSASNGADNDYTYATGTSMASPHVAGVVALLWSADPSLTRQITATKTLLQNSASHNISNGVAQACGGTSDSAIPNNQFGYGRVDALAAVQAAGVATATPTVSPTAPTATVTATSTASATATATATQDQATATATATEVAGTATSTATDVPSATPTTPASATVTATAPASATVTATPEVTATVTPGPSATPCVAGFGDVVASDFFYQAVNYLRCAGVVSGYSDFTYRPYSNITRGQITKLIVLGSGWPIDTTNGPHFLDVQPSDPFYPYVETVFNHNLAMGLQTGYLDGTFLPYNNITRGQIAKLVVAAADWPLLNPAMPSFTDVPGDNPFYNCIETAVAHNAVSGYADHTFRWPLNVTRGQAAKIIFITVTGGKQP